HCTDEQQRLHREPLGELLPPEIRPCPQSQPQGNCKRLAVQDSPESVCFRVVLRALLHPCRREYAHPPRLFRPGLLTLAVALPAAGCQEAPPPPPPAVAERAAVGTPDGRFVGSQAC